MPQLWPCACSPQTRGPILHAMYGLRPSWQLLLVLDPIHRIYITQTLDRPPQRLICRPDLVANRVTWSGFLLVSAWLPSPPLKPSPSAPSGARAERKRSGSAQRAAHGCRCCVQRKPPLGRARRLVGRVSRRWPPCSKARWQPSHKARCPLAAMLESALAAMLEGSLAGPEPGARGPLRLRPPRRSTARESTPDTTTRSARAHQARYIARSEPARAPQARYLWPNSPDLWRRVEPPGECAKGFAARRSQERAPEGRNVAALGGRLEAMRHLPQHLGGTLCGHAAFAATLGRIPCRPPARRSCRARFRQLGLAPAVCSLLVAFPPAVRVTLSGTCLAILSSLGWL